VTAWSIRAIRALIVRSKSRAVSELIEEMFDDSRYNSRARPGADSGEKERRKD